MHLETSGDLPAAFEKIAPLVDHVLMDIKLPSVTGEPATWSAHANFLTLIEKYKTGATIKLVVSGDTSEADLSAAAELICNSKTAAAVVLQPMTAASRTDRVPAAAQVLNWQSAMARTIDRSVRVIPQCHKMMNLL